MPLQSDFFPENEKSEISRAEYGEIAWRRMLEILRPARLALGWSAEELAGKIKVTPSSMLKAERGEIIPNVVFVFRWSHALGVDPGELFQEGGRAAGSDGELQS